MAERSVVVGAGLTLVPVDAEDVDALLAGDLGVHHAGRGWPHEGTAPGLSFAKAGGWSWLIVDGDGLVVGDCGTKAAPDDAGVVEIGYGLAAPSRGRGLGTRAVAALVGWLAERPEVSAVEAEVAVGNVASRRLLERLGFDLAPSPDAGYVRYRRVFRGPRTG